jgi:hypothetical protein
MDLLLGEKPSNSCSHALEASEESPILDDNTIIDEEQQGKSTHLIMYLYDILQVNCFFF